MLKLLQGLQDIRHGLWFVPAILVTLAIFLAALLVEFDATLGHDALAQWPRLFGAGAEGARSTLQTIAGAMVSVATLTFSITVLVLSTAATQYTPAVIRTFMASRPTQWVLGVFLGIFVYCLVVLRSIHGGDETFIPSLAVTFSLVLAVLGVGMLVYYIHHIASSIQASFIVSNVAEETIRAIDATYPELSQKESRPKSAGATFSCRDCHQVNAAHTGYLRTVDRKGVAAFADRHGVTVQFIKKVGDFVIEDTTLALCDREPDSRMQREFKDLYTVGHYRTVEQDIGVGIRQLVDIALRANSPGVNDTSTALLCIDYLGAVVIRLSSRDLGAKDKPAAEHLSEKEIVIMPDRTFNDFLSDVFDPLRCNAGDNIEVYVRLVDTLQLAADNVRNPAHRERLRTQLARVHEDARARITAPNQFALISKALHGAGTPGALTNGP
ncbi:DUF2254 domain-containing protein [Noviherbaspirillum aerium]|uniref:DUF2254 domain-containing protein n=1 Tax=Noviherbaspirillum aerium TaxID=2588497 RepID=UPI00178C32BD|nr:DUF2254 domain-containing protein [Noviherbaspirillum aerium]